MEIAQFIGEKQKLLHRPISGVKTCKNGAVSLVNLSDITSYVINCTVKLSVYGPLKARINPKARNTFPQNDKKVCSTATLNEP